AVIHRDRAAGHAASAIGFGHEVVADDRAHAAAFGIAEDDLRETRIDTHIVIDPYPTALQKIYALMVGAPESVIVGIALADFNVPITDAIELVGVAICDFDSFEPGEP